MFGRAPKKSSKNASTEDLKKAYKKATIKNHPDKGGDPEKELRYMGQLNYIVLVSILSNGRTENDEFSSRDDIWSFGITALELAHGHVPFSNILQ